MRFLPVLLLFLFQDAPTTALPEAWVKSMRWRCIGPAGMGGRITSLSIYEADPSTYFVATSSAGLLKTTNNGVTFEHQFDHEATSSVGAVCVAPSDKNIVWVGTGEANPRNSVTYGDGVYKSTDGGKTWKNMGLKKSFQTGAIVIHPKNPDVVYVGALGRLYGPNEERGLFKTSDGGKTWEKVLYVDDKTGVVDVIMHPADPETLLVATWERRRDEFDSHRGEPPLQDGYTTYDPIKKWGPGSGLHKTTDGGKTFRRVTKGLPSCDLGRIGLDWYRKDPNVVFAIVDCQKIGMGKALSRVYMGITGRDTEDGVNITQVTENGPADQAGIKRDDLLKSVAGKPLKRYIDLAEIILDYKAGDELEVEIVREKEAQKLKVKLEDRPGGPMGLGAMCSDARPGARIARLLPERAADKAGLVEEDVIKEVNGQEIASAEALWKLLGTMKEGDKITIKAQRDEELKEFSLTLETIDARGETLSRPHSAFLGGQAANVQNRQGANSQEFGGVYRSADGGETWTRVNSLNPRPMYFSLIRVDPSDEKNVYVGGVQLHRSNDGGKTFRDDAGNKVHADFHALWIDPKDGRHMIVGCDGGFYQTFDRTANWEHLNHLALAQFYHVCFDSRQPYHVYGGLQDNGSWGGPSRTLRSSGPLNEDWMNVGGGDGFVCRVDPTDPDIVYSESQDGNINRRNLRTGESKGIRPRGGKYRFNWNTPYLLSSHNPKIFYCAGNFVFRSVKQGDDPKVISPEIARTGRGTATALSESPRNPDVLWVGTDDGQLWITRDGGAKWTNVVEKVKLPGPRCVATIEASRFVEGRAYVAFDAHRSDDDEPYALVTEDFGETWKSIRANLPVGSTRCLREDLKNPNLLYAGTEFALFVTLDRGASWTKLNNNLPTVAVHEVAVHPSGDVIVATHGRSVWILDGAPLREMTKETLAAPAHLYAPSTATRWRAESSRGTGGGAQKFIGDNPSRGARLYYSLAQSSKVSIKIVDFDGKTVRELTSLKGDAGLHAATWDLSSAPAARSPQQPPPARGGRGGGPQGRRSGPPVAAGIYRVVLTVNDKEFSQPIKVEIDPTLPHGATPGEFEEEEDD